MLMGGFHHVRVRQRVIFKRYNIIGSHERLAAVVEDRHYYRNMKTNKQLFCVVVHHKVETLTKKYLKMSLREYDFIVNKINQKKPSVIKAKM